MESAFTIEKIRKDDPRLRRMLEVPEREKQPSFHATIQLLPGTDELQVEESFRWRHCRLTDDAFNRLRAVGLRGRLLVTGCGYLGRGPYQARTLIVAQRQLREAVDLPQPDGCEVIYYQVGDEWRMEPPDAPVLQKRFRLSIDPANQRQTLLWAEAYYGSEAGGGGGAFTWEAAT
ncbi:MAG: hypothetical protein JOZ02_03730 [Acidobacteria bacterium]|nr:hypothetical protein [Acidobacteriota bacterium]